MGHNESGHNPVREHFPDGHSELLKPAERGVDAGKVLPAEVEPASGVDPGKLVAGEVAAPHHHARTSGLPQEFVGQRADGTTIVVKPDDAQSDPGKLTSGERSADGGHGRRFRAGGEIEMSFVKAPDSGQPDPGKRGKTSPGAPDAAPGAADPLGEPRAPAGQVILDAAERSNDGAERARLNAEARTLARELTQDQGPGRGRGGPDR
jgi:hypothetical protein